MKLRLVSLPLLSMAVVLSNTLTTSTLAAHTDIVPYLEGSESWPFGTLGKLRVGSHEFGSDEMLTLNVLVFAGSTKNYATQPGWASNIDPGWSQTFEELYPEGTNPLPPLNGSLFIESIVEPRLGRGLMVWDGNGAVNFQPVSTGEIIDLSFSGRSLSIDSGVTAGGSMLLTDLTSDTFHLHTTNRIWGSSSHDPSDNPTPGFYLFGLRFRLEDRGQTRVSDPFFILMAHEFDKYTYETEIINGEEVEVERLTPQMQAAMNWVNGNLQTVPEPASGLLISMGLATLGLRRFRKNQSL